MDDELTYSTKNPSKIMFLDFAASGASDDATSRSSGSARISESVMIQMRKTLREFRGGELGGTGFAVSEEGSNLRFTLKAGLDKISFEIANEGARGIYLNATWNPTRVITGQNVLSPRVRSFDVGGIELDLLPGKIVEFPFRYFVACMDKQFNGDWAGKSTIARHLENGGLYWRRLDFTTYTKRFENEETMQSVLRLIELMAMARSTRDFQQRDGKQVDKSLRTFANVRLDSYRDKSGSKWQTMAFSKMRAHNDPTQLFRFSLYDKVAEVLEKKNDPNFQVLENYMHLIKLRLRLELQTSPQTYDGIPSLIRILDMSESDAKCKTSRFLNEGFPSHELAEERKQAIWANVMRQLHLDTVLTPRNPHSFVRKAQAEVDVEEKPSAVALVVLLWREAYDKPLTSPKDWVVKGGKLYKKATRQEVLDAIDTLRGTGLDVLRLSFLELQTFWEVLVESHVTNLEDQRLIALKEKRRNGDLTSKERVEMLTAIQKIEEKAKERALMTKREIAEVLLPSLGGARLLEGGR